MRETCSAHAPTCAPCLPAHGSWLLPPRTPTWKPWRLAGCFRLTRPLCLYSRKSRRCLPWAKGGKRGGDHDAHSSSGQALHFMTCCLLQLTLTASGHAQWVCSHAGICSASSLTWQLPANPTLPSKAAAAQQQAHLCRLWGHVVHRHLHGLRGGMRRAEASQGCLHSRMICPLGRRSPANCLQARDPDTATAAPTSPRGTTFCNKSSSTGNGAHLAARHVVLGNVDDLQVGAVPRFASAGSAPCAL